MGGLDGIKNHNFLTVLIGIGFLSGRYGHLLRLEKHSLKRVSNFDKTFTRLPFGSVATDLRRDKASGVHVSRDKFSQLFQNFSYEGSPKAKRLA